MHSKHCTGIGNLRINASHNLLVLLADVVSEHLGAKNTKVGTRIGVPGKQNETKMQSRCMCTHLILIDVLPVGTPIDPIFGLDDGSFVCFANSSGSISREKWVMFLIITLYTYKKRSHACARAIVRTALLANLCARTCLRKLLENFVLIAVDDTCSAE
jgi:hypothetical protein